MGRMRDHMTESAEGGIMVDTPELLWRSIAERLRAFIARRVENKADVEDILQDVFLRMHQRVGTLRHVDRIVSWLFQITRNSIVDYYRATGRREISVGGDKELQQRIPHTNSSAFADSAEKSRKELSACLRPMIGRLPADYRRAMVLVSIQGMPQRVAAERLGISLSGLKSRVQRGRERLKLMLLECCHVQLDRYGTVIDHETRSGSCQACDV